MYALVYDGGWIEIVSRLDQRISDISSSGGGGKG
jgi:hypothetical protein